MSDNENALRVGFPQPRALPPCLVGAHGEPCDNLCAEVAKNTGMEVAQCGCPCHGRDVASDPLAQALAEVQRLTAELALKDQALDEIKELADGWRRDSALCCDLHGAQADTANDCADDIQRVLTRLDTQGETK